MHRTAALAARHELLWSVALLGAGLAWLLLSVVRYSSPRWRVSKRVVVHCARGFHVAANQRAKEPTLDRASNALALVELHLDGFFD